MNDRITNRTILAALPGWSVAVYIEGGKDGDKTYEDYLSPRPIIAWDIEREKSPIRHNVIPITVDGNMENSANPWAIKTPEGEYVIQGDTIVTNEADALKELRQIDRWRKAEQAKQLQRLRGS